MSTADEPIKEKMMKRDCESDDDDDVPEDDRRKRVAGGKKGGGGDPKICQAEKCGADLSGAKAYHRRHKVCEHHAKAQAVVVAGIRQRFCQQCSRFHELSEFDDAKRSCRRRLAGHNERRRKNPGDGEGSSGGGGSRMKGGGGGGGGGSQLKEMSCDDRGRIQMSHRVQENSAYKHFHVR